MLPDLDAAAQHGQPCHMVYSVNPSSPFPPLTACSAFNTEKVERRAAVQIPQLSPQRPPMQMTEESDARGNALLGCVHALAPLHLYIVLAAAHSQRPFRHVLAAAATSCPSDGHPRASQRRPPPHANNGAECPRQGHPPHPIPCTVVAAT